MDNPLAIPGYRILRVISSGGMAAVYLAIQESFGREVALKVMSPSLTADPGFAERFLREARIVAQMHHSAIVPVFDVGEAQGHQYLSMEYLSGGDLKQRLQHEAGPQLACRVCVAMADALDLAHRKGFVHRDIKPENILFREDGSPVLTDFGIARAIDSVASLTRSGMLVGTPSYMSPEQLRGEEVDGRSDLYSLGIVFYESLTGSVPFRADSSISVAIKHLSENLPPLPPAFAAYQPFLDRLTAKDRSQRFATGAEVAQALQAVGIVGAPARQPTPAGAGAPGQGSGGRQPTPIEPTLIYEAPLIAERFDRDDEPLLPLEPGHRRERPDPAPLRPRESLSVRDYRRSHRRHRRRSRWPLVLLALLILGGVALWQAPGLRETVLALADRSPPQEPAREVTAERLQQAGQQLQSGDLAGALAGYGAVLAEDADNAQARAGMAQIASAYIDEARAALARGDIDSAEQALQRASAVESSHRELAGVRGGIDAEKARQREQADQQARQQAEQAAAEEARRREQDEQEQEAARQRAAKAEAEAHQRQAAEQQSRARQVAEQRQAQDELLEKAQSALARGELMQPEGSSAVGYYRAVLKLNPRNTAALTGLLNVHARLLGDAERDIKEGNLERAAENLEAARIVSPSHPETARVERLYSEAVAAQLDRQREKQAQLGQAWNHLETIDEVLGRRPMSLFLVDLATRRFDQARQLAPQLPELAEFKSRIQDAYSAAVSAALMADKQQEALAAIEHARRRNWMTPALQQQEAAIRQQTRQNR